MRQTVAIGPSGGNSHRLEGPQTIFTKWINSRSEWVWFTRLDVYRHEAQTNAWLCTDCGFDSTGSKRWRYVHPYLSLVEDKISYSVKRTCCSKNTFTLHGKSVFGAASCCEDFSFLWHRHVVQSYLWCHLVRLNCQQGNELSSHHRLYDINHSWFMEHQGDTQQLNKLGNFSGPLVCILLALLLYSTQN